MREGDQKSWGLQRYRTEGTGIVRGQIAALGARQGILSALQPGAGASVRWGRSAEKCGDILTATLEKEKRA